MSTHRQYACVYAEEFPLQALLRLRQELRERPCAVLEGVPPLQRVCSLNVRGSAIGAELGMTKTELETLPTVVALVRSSLEEASARTALLECAGSFSPSVEDLTADRSFLCVIDIAGTEKLYGPPASLARTLLDRVRGLGIAARVAIAANFHVAICKARGIDANKQIAVIPPGHESRALAPLPIHVLDLTPEQAETFALWGIRTLGDIAALPEKPLIARMGQQGSRLRQLALGTLPHHFVPIEPRFELDEFIELDSPVELLESLLFVAGVLLGQLIARAAGRALALASITVTLALEGGGPQTRTVRPALPSNDKQLWIKLIHLDLEAHPPGAPILSLRITAEPGHTSKVQLGLFSPQLPDPTRLDVTLARIKAIVGEEFVGSPALNDSHRADDFTMRPFVVSSGPIQRQASRAQPMTAMRQLRPAEGIVMTVYRQRPAAFFFRHNRYRVERAYGPWLSSGDWWSETRWGIQQWDIEAYGPDGSVLCACLVRDPAQNQWRVAGLYD